MIGKLLALLLFFTIPIDNSIGRLTFLAGEDEQKAVCTAFSINQKKAIWMTASHCVGKEMFVGELYRVMSVDYQDDGDEGIAVFKTDPRTGDGIPALKLGAPPKRGDRIETRGWGRGFLNFIFDGRVQVPSIFIEGIVPDLLLTTASGMEGMSGGPILDKDGKVISLILGGVTFDGSTYYTYGVSYPHFKEVFDKYR